MAWVRGGRKICELKGIQYVDFNKAEEQAKLTPIHYIFAIDASGSMYGEAWNNLLTSFKCTIGRIAELDKEKDRIRVSVLSFDHSLHQIDENVRPGEVTMNLQCAGGEGITFEKPFQKAAEYANKYIEDAIIGFIFMTDGKDDYPRIGVRQLKSIQEKYRSKWYYNGILSGEAGEKGQQTLMNIAMELRGNTDRAYNPEQLTRLFTKSVEFIEAKKRVQ